MKQISEKEILVGNSVLKFDIKIKKIIEYKDFFIVLIRERKEIPNNIIAYNYNGKELWKINDIVNAKVLRGYDDIAKVSDTKLNAYYELGIIFEIDVSSMQIVSKTYIR